MAEESNNSDVAGLKNELDEAISTLDRALLDAGRSASIIRDNIATIIGLAERAGEMEAAIARAREQLNLGIDRGGTPSLRAVPTPPAHEPIAGFSIEAPEEKAPELEPQAEIESVQEPEEGEAMVEEPAAAIEEPSETSRCLRLGVASKSGNLDLKEVDGSVNENPSVIDVALLDYDGRAATLKLWINDAADPTNVREALVSSLNSHLGEKNIELSLDFEEETAA